MGKTRVNLDGDAPVDATGSLVLRSEHIARRTHIIGGRGADRRINIGAALGQLGNLRVIGMALGQGCLKDRRVRGDPDNTPGCDQLGEIARIESVPGEIIEPDSDSGLAQFGEISVLIRCAHGIHPFLIRGY